MFSRGENGGRKNCVKWAKKNVSMSKVAQAEIFVLVIFVNEK